MIHVKEATIRALAEPQREPTSRELANKLLQRYPEKLKSWDIQTLTNFNIARSLKAEKFELFSKADVSAFIEITLFLTLSLESTREFRLAIASAPNKNKRMLHAVSTLPSGFISHLTVQDAPNIWLKRFREENHS